MARDSYGTNKRAHAFPRNEKSLNDTCRKNTKGSLSTRGPVTFVYASLRTGATISNEPLIITPEEAKRHEIVSRNTQHRR